MEQRDRDGRIGIILVGADRIRALNRDFRGEDRPTDVLSFDLSDRPEEIEGEIYVGVRAAAARARRLGYPVTEELARLMIHGLLHLAGHDHHSPGDGRRMAAATRRWLDVWRASCPPAPPEKES